MLIKNSDLKDIKISISEFNEIDKILVSPSDLNFDGFYPELINCKKIINFNSLYLQRGKISELNLLPIKTDEIHKLYRSLDHNILTNKLLTLLENNDLILLENEFKYDLPTDVNQFIIWIKDDIERNLIIEFIAKINKFLKLDKLILFERPETNIKFVKKSFSNIRHIHLWTYKYNFI